MKKINKLVLVALGVFFGAEVMAAGKPVDVTVKDFFKNPLGFNLENMSFSWKLPEGEVAQSAYQIVVADSEDNLEKSPIWDTGKVLSDKSVKVDYTGKPFGARKKGYFKVRYWNDKGEVSSWSDVCTFEQGLLSNSDWGAKWISSSEKTPLRYETRSYGNHPRKITLGGDEPAYMRREYNLRSGIAKARAYVASLGNVQFYINGKKVGKDYWGTGWTDYRRRVQANTYDVTDLLRKGDNTVAILLGGGWYTGRMGWTFNACNYGDNPKVIAQVEIEYNNGEKEVLITDKSWKWSRGPIVRADIFEGEDYDARKEMPNWNDIHSQPSIANLWGLFANTQKFDDSAWKSVAVEELGEKPLLQPRRNPPVVKKAVLHPISVKKIASGTFIFDLGQNMIGWPKIKIPATPGRKIKVRYAEMLNKDGTMYTDNYRTARSLDYYICKGDGIEEYEPVLTFHGFRYVEISGLADDVEASKDWVEGHVVFSDLELTGSFVCSEAKINQLQSNIQWGQRCNFLEIPTDCPQRDERMGWMGDAQVFIPTAAYNMNVNAFFTKWLVDVRDAQSANGSYPDIAPLKYPKNFNNRGGAAWSDGGVICPWEIYLAYGDVQMLRDNYPAVQKWMNFLMASSKDYIRDGRDYGDWLQPNSPYGNVGETSMVLIGTAYFVRSADLSSKIANVLGKKEDAAKYKNIANKVREAFCKKYLKPDGSLVENFQTAYLLALAFDIPPENMRSAVFAKFLKTLEAANYHLRTGFVGTPLLNSVLTKYGRADLAYRLLFTETYPSWLYPINQGATTMWERWNSYSHKDGFGDVNMNSFNHYAYGAIGQWMYEHVAGLWHDENNAGFKNTVFAPKLTDKMSFASATKQTPYGKTASFWRRENGMIEWFVKIPPNSTGTLKFPTKNVASIKINNKALAGYEIENDQPVLKNVKAGDYAISFKE